MFDNLTKSPGISKNQNLKDRVLQDVYNRKIKDLKSTQQHLQSLEVKCECWDISLNFLLLFRRERTRAKENLYKVGELPSDQDQLSCQ